MSLSNPEYSQSDLLRPIDIKSAEGKSKGGLIALAFGAIGVVFGDIGTSPLYALKACFDPDHGIPMTTESIYGVISMVFWAFIVVVSLKYVLFVMRANNHGEGGILSLMALALRTAKSGSKRAGTIMMVGVLGACLFYGDAVLTPPFPCSRLLRALKWFLKHLPLMCCPSPLLFSLFYLFLRKKERPLWAGFLGLLCCFGLSPSV